MLQIVVFTLSLSGLAVPIQFDVQEDQTTTVINENVVFLGHTTAMWDPNESTRPAVRKLIGLAQKRQLFTIGTVYPFFNEIESEIKKNYFFQEEVDLAVSSIGGQHNLQFPHLKSIFFVGGNLDRCLCQSIRSVVDGTSHSKNFRELNLYIVRDGTYAEWPAYVNPEVSNAMDFVKLFFVPAFDCPKQNHGGKMRRVVSDTKLRLYFDGKWIQDFDLEPGDGVPIDKLSKSIHLHFIHSSELEIFLDKVGPI